CTGRDFGDERFEVVSHCRASGARVCGRNLAGRCNAASAFCVPGGCDFKKIFQHQVPVLGGDTLRMELHAMDGQPLVHQSHHEAVIGLRIYFKFGRHARSFDDKRMIPGCLQRSVDTAEESGALVFDLGHLSMNRCGTYHFAAESLPDRLMTEADPEYGNGRGSRGDQLEADTRFIRGAGTGRQYDRVRLRRHDVRNRHSVVSMHDNVSSELSQIVEEVEGEAVVVVDDDDHVPPCCQGFTVGLVGGQAAPRVRGYWPRFAMLAKRRASSAARNKAFALLMHSCCSKSGLLSATIPAPAWTYILPSFTSAVRSTIHVSICPVAEK